MKFLHVITSVNPAAGGPIEGLVQLSKIMDKEGHTTEIASLDSPDDAWVQKCPVTVHPLGPSNGTYAQSPNFIPWMKNNHDQYDVVVIRGLWQYGGYATWRVLKNTQTPYFVFPHGMLDPWFKNNYPLKHLKKVVYWLGVESKVLRDAQAVCFTSEDERLLARQSFRPYDIKEVVVNYGTARPEGELDQYKKTFLDKFTELREKRILLFLSRIHHKKGCDLLIEAFAQIANRDSKLHLVIAGPDQQGWQKELQLQANKLGIGDRITWPGMLQGELKWGAFRASEVFILPSHQENFGIVVAEALSCEIPVLISNKVNIWREVENANAGFIGDDTVEGTLQILQKWLTCSKEEQQQMSSNALDCFQRNFEIHRAAQSLIEVVESKLVAKTDY